MGNTTAYTYDALGDRTTSTSPAGLVTAYAYDAAGNLLTTTLDGYTGNPSNPIPAENLVEESRAYDPAGRLASVTNVAGTQTDYTYYGNGQLASSYVVGPGSSAHQTRHAPTATTRPATSSPQTRPGGLVTNAAYNPDNQVVSQTEDPSGADLTTTARYDRDGNVISESRTGGGVTQTQTMTYNRADEQLIADRRQHRRQPDHRVRAGRARPGDLRDRPERQHHPHRERRGGTGGRADRPGRAEPERQRECPGHRQPGHHDRLRHLRRPGRVLRRQRQRHHRHLQRRRPGDLGHRPDLHGTRLDRPGQRHHHDVLQQPGRANRPRPTRSATSRR